MIYIFYILFIGFFILDFFLLHKRNNDIFNYFQIMFLLVGLSINSYFISHLSIQSSNKVDGINCFKSVKKQHLSPSRSKNFPKKSSKIDCYNYLDKPKEIVKARKTSTPSEKVTTGAAIILNPIGAAFWLIDKVVSTGVDKTINK